MQVLIIEDEMLAARRLKRLLQELAPEAHILEVLDSVEDAVEWLGSHPVPDLCFMDIQLADGLSFDIFRQTEVGCPVIFTTAYDQYAVRAFRVNGLDYLLKPVEETLLSDALDRFQSSKKEGVGSEVMEVLRTLQNRDRKYREHFLVKVGDQLKHIPVAEAAWFQADSGYVNLGLKNGHKVLLDKSLDQIREDLNPETFYQINRKMIVRMDAVSKIYTYLNSRLRLELAPNTGEEVIVSRDRVKGFKEWLDR